MENHNIKFLKEVLEQVSLINELFDLIKNNNEYKPEHVIEHTAWLLIELENALELEVKCNE